MAIDPIIPVSRLRPVHAFRAVRRLIDDPDDTDQVFVILQAMRGRSGHWMFDRFRHSATGTAVLNERRDLLRTLQNRAALARLPAGSLGNAYLAFMDARQISADGLVTSSGAWRRDPVPDAVARFRARMRDMHDLTHVLTGYGCDPLGELCLLAYMYAHTRNLGMAMIVLMGLIRGLRQRRGIAGALREAWRHGRAAAWLPEQDWEGLLDQPLDSLRRRLGVETPARYRAICGRTDG